jgi:hypothetical protein
MYVNDAGLAGPFAKAEISNMFNGRLHAGYQSVVVLGGATTSTIIPGLAQGTGYQILVSAHNARGYGYPLVAYPAFASPKQAPSAPFNASFYALSLAQLKLTWSTPLSVGGAPITMDRVEWDVDSSFKNVPANGNVRYS